MPLQSEQFQSGNVQKTTDDAAQKTQTTTFADESPVVQMLAPAILDSSIYDGYTPNIELSEFLSRPVLIYTADWAEYATLGPLNFKPWTLFFSNTAITRKIQNFAYLSCNLKIKIIVNASPFFYGLAFATYRPFSNTTFKPGQLKDALNNEGPSGSATCRQRIDILPSKSQGGEMMLPYINIRNWIRIGRIADFNTMGEIDMWSIDQLYNASTSSSASVTIQVFAWAEDVKLSGATSQLPLQALEICSRPLQADTANRGGPISNIATSISKAAGQYAFVGPPEIAPYALATEVVFKGVSDIASSFGYSDAPVIDNVAAFKNLPFHGMCSSEISSPYEKLTIDPKNQITIDNRIAGGDGVDEMSISYLVGKRCVYRMNTWSDISAVDTILVRINVSPFILMGATGGLPTTNIPLYMHPMTLVSNMFRFWRGTMVYRFKFICTPYHRGRLIVYWDPMSSADTSFSATTNLNIIVDISVNREVEIEVPYMQPVSYLRVGSSFLKNLSISENSVSAYDPDLHNGRLCVKVLNKLTAPDASAPVLIYCEVSMKDADFASPSDASSTPNVCYSYLEVQSADIEDNQEIHSQNIAKVKITQHPKLNTIYCGERILSIRSLARRSTHYRSYCFSNISPTATWAVIYGNFSRRPCYFGYDVNGWSAANKISAVGVHNFNYVSDHFINKLRPCFVGDRGSINYNINCRTSGFSSVYIDSLALARSNLQAVSTNDVYLDTSMTTNLNNLAKLNMLASAPFGYNGGSLTNQKTQAGLQVATPLYSRYKFQSTNPLTARLGSSDDESNADNVGLILPFKVLNGLNPTDLTIDLYVAAGIDYQLLFFVNVPTIWVYSTIPNGA